MPESSADSSADSPDILLPLLLVGNGIVGGVEEYVLSLLREFRRRGQRSLVVAPFLGDFTNTLLEQGHPPEDFYVFDMPGHEVNFRALAHVVAVMRARRVSLVHSHLLPADVLAGPAAAAAGAPMISTLHGMLHHLEEVLLHDFCGTEYVSVSRAGQASAIANGVPAAAVHYIPNGVDLSALDPAAFDGEGIRAELGVGPEELLVVSVARLSPEKNPLGFIRAAEVAGARDPRLVFAMVGTGMEEPRVREEQARSPLGERLLLLGLRRDVPRILAAGDVLCLTSETESLPFAVMEGMAMRLPAICYAVGGLSELITHGENGMLVPCGDHERFADAILQLAGDPLFRARLGTAARAKIAADHDFARAAEATLALYRKLVAERNGRRTEREAPRRPAAPATPPAAPVRVSPGSAADDLAGVPVVDSHLHLSGCETAEQVLGILDGAGIEAACLISPFIDTTAWLPLTGEALRRANAFLLRLTAHSPARLWGLVSVDPRARSAPREVERLSRNPTVRGLKLIPHGWEPDDACALRVYEAAEDCGLPILFHSGIFISGRVSNACRPAKYEAVRQFPRLRVVLAHLGWPWVDEAIAVAFMDPLKGLPPQILLDTSPGTPPIYRGEAIRKALDVLGPGPLLWGCDRFLPIDPEVIRGILDADLAAFRAAGADDEAIRRIFSLNAGEVFAAGHSAPAAAAPEPEALAASV